MRLFPIVKELSGASRRFETINQEGGEIIWFKEGYFVVRLDSGQEVSLYGGYHKSDWESALSDGLYTIAREAPSA